MRLVFCFLLCFCSFAFAIQPTPVKAVGEYSVLKQFNLGGPGGWDYLTVDADASRLYISRSDRVLVVSTTDGALIATIEGTEGVHGIALAPAIGKGFTSNGRADSVTVFDLASLKPTGVIAVGGHNPDAILYDNASKHVYTFNGRSNDVSVIDPVKGSVLAKIPVGGKPEFAVSDNAGRIFLNIEDKSQLVAIDSLSAKVVATWPLPNCEDPSGLAFDLAHQRLFSTCANGLMVVTDSNSGKQVAKISIGKGPDGAAFDAQRGLVFSSNGGDGTLSVIRQDGADVYSVVATVPTQKSARTLALDGKSHRIFVVGAEFGPRPMPSKEEPRPRAPVVEGSFKVLVLGN